MYVCHFWLFVELCVGQFEQSASVISVIARVIAGVAAYVYLYVCVWVCLCVHIHMCSWCVLCVVYSYVAISYNSGHLA